MPIASPASLASSLARLRQIAALLARLGQLAEPIDSPTGLRQALETVVALGRAVGLSEVWLDRLQTVLDNDFVFRVVLALVRLATEAATAASHDDGIRIAANAGDDAIVGPQALADWLPLVVELLALLRMLRGVA